MTEKTANTSYENLSPDEIGKIFFQLYTGMTQTDEIKHNEYHSEMKRFMDTTYGANTPPAKFLEIIQQLRGMHPNSKVHKLSNEIVDTEKVVRYTALCYDGSERWYYSQIDMNEQHKITTFKAFPTVAPKPEGEITREELYDKLTEFVDDMVENEDFSGNILIAEGEKIDYELSRGLRNQELEISHDHQSKFNLGSMPKMFTATIIGYLVQTDKISVEDKIGVLLDDLDLSDEISEITIHQLLTHTSGLGNYWDKMEGREDEFLTISDYEEFLTTATLTNVTHGIKYSNLGFQTLGMIIERITGEDYFEVVRKVIFDPLEMHDTGYPIFDELNDNLLSIPYSKQVEKNKLVKVDWPSKRGSAAGGAVSTTCDLFKFFHGLFNEKILSDQVLKEFTTGKVNMAPDGALKYAYGFGHHKVYDIYSIGHNGGAHGINADGRYFSNDFIIVVLANRDPGPAGKIVDYFGRLLNQLAK